MARNSAPRVVFFGMDSSFSTRSLQALLDSGVRVVAVVKPMGGVALRRTNVATRVPKLATRLRESVARLLSPLPAPLHDALLPEDPFTLAERHGIPCYMVGDASGPRALRALRRHAADIWCVAFFNQLLRAEALAIPRIGAVNLHPSLLPAYRGPAPLFWIFKDGARETGVTLHVISRGEDDGDVLEQARVPLPDGIRGPELLEQLATTGARLMARGTWALWQGVAVPTPQDPSRASRHPRPEPPDQVVDFGRGAVATYNFVRGVGAWVPLHARVGAATWDVVDALAVDPGLRLPADHELSADVLRVQCPDGVVTLRVRHRGWGWAGVAGTGAEGG